MSLGPVIDVAIGLIFVYLLLGLITTAAQELVASYFQWRGKLLKRQIADLVANGDVGGAFFQQVFGHGLIRGTTLDRPPSYLTAQRFTLAVIDTLSADGQGPVFSQIESNTGVLPAGDARDSLLALVKDAAGDLDVLKKSIAAWYDDAMDRLTGVYKRRSQKFAIWFGLIAAVTLNIDSLQIANRLWHDDALRTNVAAAASAYQSSHARPEAATKSAEEARSDLDANVAQLADLQLPIGWDAVVTSFVAKHCAPASIKIGDTRRGDPDEICSESSIAEGAWGWQLVIWVRAVFDYLVSLGLGRGLFLLAGWFVTAIATSFGAPFWFDLLNSILNVRSAGPKPPRADAQGVVS